MVDELQVQHALYYINALHRRRTAVLCLLAFCLSSMIRCISSLNCQGLGNFQKQRDVFHCLKQKGQSIYCLQDTHFDKKIEKYVTSE